MPQRRRAGALWTGAALAASTVALASGLAPAALAQTPPVVARPVVQSIPTEDSRRLNEALARLGRNPRDIVALADAGDAARGMGDFEAAIGFYRRADQIGGNEARVKSGLARALVASGKPVEALAEFDAAVKAGVPSRDIAADYGLAYDLVGDNARAQQHYTQVLNGPEGDVVRQRLALSQIIAGDAKASEATLVPLLRKQDKPAWRARAFALAIAGDTRQAVEVATSILPRQLAEGIAPYLRYMPRLTRAQQAAAANLGLFPRAFEIGRDEPAIAAYAASRAPSVKSAGAAPASKGTPSGESSKTARRTAVDASRVAPPEPRPAIEKEAAKPASAPAVPAVPPATAKPSASAPSAAVAAARNPEPAKSSGFDLATLPSAQAAAPSIAKPAASTPVTTPASAATAAASPASAPAVPETPSGPAFSLADAFADLGAPTMQAAPANGAVDITKIEPARPEVQPKAAEPDVASVKADSAKADAKKEAEAKKTAVAKKAAKPAHPSRIWVQIGVGRDKGAIAFDWRRWTRQSPTLFKGRDPYIADKGATNRILAGPFESEKDAASFAADIRKAAISNAFVWISAAGEVVDELPAK